MPRESGAPLKVTAQREPRLSFDELGVIAAAFTDLGVRKLRITGGEPLVRRNLHHLVAKLAQLPVLDLCMTTNGSLLADRAQALFDAGLKRVTVSLDALDELTFRRMTDSSTAISSVLAGIERARKVGLDPIKVNMVVQRGVNEHAIVPMAAWARREQLELRFIEYMDVGCSNGWQPADVVTAAEIHDRIHRIWPLLAPSARNHDAAQRYCYADGLGQIGIVASISKPFCGGCTRARVSSRGEFHLCLFAPAAADLGHALRQGQDVRPLIADAWLRRNDRYSELRAHAAISHERPEMSAIGG